MDARQMTGGFGIITVMKRKRKEHLAGISIRKFVGLKKSALIKRTLKDKSLKAAGRTRLERVMRGMAEYFADEAKDRPRYFERFVATWQAALDDISDCSKQIFVGPGFVSVHPEGGLNPYGLLFLLFFARLMDNLTYDEEETLRELLTRMDGAWGVYFSVIRMRWPRLSPLVDRAEEIREALQLEVQRLFFGEIVPALTTRWVVAYKGLEKALELIGKETNHGLA